MERVGKATRMDPWFLREFKELAAFEDEIAAAGSPAGLAADPALFFYLRERFGVVGADEHCSVSAAPYMVVLVRIQAQAVKPFMF